MTEWALLTDLVEPEIRAVSIRYLGTVFSFGSTLGSVLSGLLTVYLPYSWVFLLAVGLKVGAIAAIKAMRREAIPETPPSYRV